jgi:dTMP kinase
MPSTRLPVTKASAPLKGEGLKGFFLTFEGTEGTGKSTQVALLSAALREEGRDVVVTREPGGTALGRELRRILLGTALGPISSEAELFLYLADRAQHVAEVIAPALAGGKVVICDRFSDATIAYQGFGRGLDRRMIERLNAGATSGTLPELTLLLDMSDVEEGLRRAVGRNRREGVDGVEDRFEQEKIAFHRRVQEGYRSLAAEEPGRFRLFPATLPIEDLHAMILPAVRSCLPSRRG